jgi:cellulose biosynthesis protein BcsQ
MVTEHALALVEYTGALVPGGTTIGAMPALSLWITIVIVCLTTLLPLHFVLSGRRAQRFSEHLSVYTFANQKGGVGKTATAMLIAKKMALRHTDCNVLVLDCSVFGDITGLLLSDQDGDPPEKAVRLIQQGKTIDGQRGNRGAAYSALRANSSWWPTWLTGGFKVKNHMAQVQTLGNPCTDAPPNLYLMTNQMDENMEFDESELSGKAISIVAQTIRSSLVRSSEESGRKWIVIVDTDGGTKHTLTQVALCLADYIVVPTDADVKVIKRIKSMLRFVQSLRRAGFSTAEVGLVFFNMIETTNNDNPNAESAALGLNWDPRAAETRTAMQNVVARLQTLRGSFPDELRCVDDNMRTDPSGEEQTFGGVRKGGGPTATAFRAPWQTPTSGPIEPDLEIILNKMDRLPTRLNLNARFAAM